MSDVRGGLVAAPALISALYDYGRWANERLLAVADKLDAAQLNQKLTKGADPILQTFGHLVGADIRWFARWRNQSPPPFSPADWPSLDVVRRHWSELYPARRAYIASLDDAQLMEPIAWRRGDGREQHVTRWQAMVHCANHGTQHRSEIAAMLTDLGHSPGNMDMVDYLVDQPRTA